MTDARDVIKRVRKVGLLVEEPPSDPVGVIIDTWRTRQLWERDKIIKRDQNFQKMKAARERQVEVIRAAKERQEEIRLERLDNLAKARKVLKKKRSTK